MAELRETKLSAGPLIAGWDGVCDKLIMLDKLPSARALRTADGAIACAVIKVHLWVVLKGPKLEKWP